MDQQEKDLLAGALRYDVEILAVIYDAYQPRLYAYALRLLGDETQAEDCVADTFLRFLKALRAGNGPKDYLQAYLYRIAHNWITDCYRRRPPAPLALDETMQGDIEDHPDVKAEQKLVQEQMRAALSRLTPEQRQVVVLRYFEGCSIETTAAALQKPIGAIKALQHRALAALSRMLIPQEDKEVDDVPGKRNRPAVVEVV